MLGGKFKFLSDIACLSNKKLYSSEGKNPSDKYFSRDIEVHTDQNLGLTPGFR